MTKKLRFSASITAILALVATLLPAGVFAEEGAVVEEIVVTGSRLKRSDLTSISPITVLSAEDLAASGNLTLEDFLQDLPSTIGGADYGSSVNNGNPGLATVQLRGLGPNRTLVLLNGQRPAQAGPDGIVDLNMIPTAIIERIDVLRDGASTVYGSDAIAGVVNIITKKDFEGFQLNVDGQITGESDGEQLGVSGTWGSNFERGNIVLSAQYTRREEIGQKDRGFSECPLTDGTTTTTVCSGSGTTTPAQIVAQNASWVVDQGSGAVRPFDSNADAYNFAQASYMVTPQKVWSLYGAADYQLVESSDFTTVEAYIEGSFANRESEQLMAAVGTFWSPTVPADNPLNPFGDDLCAGNPSCVAPTDVNVARRLAETGGRDFLQDAESWRFVTGLRGDFTNGWSWDVSYNYADWTDSQRDGGRAVRPRINAMLDPALCAADPLCDPTAGGVGLWDAFNRDTMTPAQIAYGTVAVNTIDRSRLRDLQVNFNGDFLDAFQTPGGEWTWAAGYERRSEKAQSLPDGGSALGAVYSTPGNVTEGSYSVDEFYGELRMPLLADMTLINQLTAEVSVRWSDYNFVSDDSTNWKFALEWAPIADLRLRYTYSDGFRAPNLSERFLGQQQTAASYSDPCNNWDTIGSATIQANCGPGGDNLPAGFQANAPQATTIEGGNPDLEPETSESTTFGVVWTPSFLTGLSVTMDWYNIEIDDAVGTAGTGNVITRCYNSAGFTDPLCSLLLGPTFVGEGASNLAPDRRNAINQVTGIALTNQNLSSFETAGLDFSIDYGFDSGIGNWLLRATGSYIDKYDYLPFEGGQEEQLAGKFGIDPYNKNAITAFPELAINVSATWTRDSWGGNVMVKWFDETEDGFDGSACGNVCVAKDKYYVDMQGWYEWNNMRFVVGARNLFDEKPPYVTNYDDMNTLHYSYDTAGQYWYARWQMNM